MRKRKLKCPCIYRHFKGNMYVTLDVSKATSRQALKTKSYIEYMTVLHTETNEHITIYMDANARLFHDDKYGDELVIYRSLSDDSGCYARPKEMFMGEIDKERYPEYIDRYRFMECKKEVKYYE